VIESRHLFKHYMLFYDLYNLNVFLHWESIKPHLPCSKLWFFKEVHTEAWIWQYDKSKLNNLELSDLNFHIFVTPWHTQGHRVYFWNVLICGKYETRGLRCGNADTFFQNFLKSDNLLHKRVFVDLQVKTTVVIAIKYYDKEHLESE